VENADRQRKKYTVEAFKDREVVVYSEPVGVPQGSPMLHPEQSFLANGANRQESK
jgi:hypothetical protein